MLMNFLSHLVALDIAWFVTLFEANWFFLFAFLLFAHIFAPKRWIAFFCIFTFILWGWMDMITLTGWVIFVAGFMLLNYVMKIVLVGFVENSPLPQNYVIVINEISATILWVWFGIFLMGAS